MSRILSGNSLVARAATVLFSLSMLVGFVWYSHVKAQPKEERGAEASAGTTAMAGSKKLERALEPGDVDRILKQGQGVSAGSTKAVHPAMISGSKSYAGAIIQVDGKMSVQGAPDPAPAPPTSGAKPMLLPGSKSITLGMREPADNASTVPPPSPTPPVAQSKGVAPPSSAILMLGSKSGGIFVPTPPAKASPEEVKPTGQSADPPQLPVQVKPAQEGKIEAPKVPQASQSAGGTSGGRSAMISSSKWVRIFTPEADAALGKKFAKPLADSPPLLAATPATVQPVIAPARRSLLRRLLGDWHPPPSPVSDTAVKGDVAQSPVPESNISTP